MRDKNDFGNGSAVGRSMDFPSAKILHPIRTLRFDARYPRWSRMPAILHVRICCGGRRETASLRDKRTRRKLFALTDELIPSVFSRSSYARIAIYWRADTLVLNLCGGNHREFLIRTRL